MKAILISITLTFSFLLHAQHAEHVRIVSLKNKPIVQAKINGKKAYFLIDTGSDISIINASQLERFELTDQKIYHNSRTALGFNGGKAEIKRVKGAQLALTEYATHEMFYSLNLDCLVNSIKRKTNLRIVGIIGADVLIKYHCVIDYEKQQLTILSQRSNKAVAAK